MTVTDLEEEAWGVIANAWAYVETVADETTGKVNHAQEWLDAATSWRDKYHEKLYPIDTTEEVDHEQ